MKLMTIFALVLFQICSSSDLSREGLLEIVIKLQTVLFEALEEYGNSNFIQQYEIKVLKAQSGLLKSLGNVLREANFSQLLLPGLEKIIIGIEDTVDAQINNIEANLILYNSTLPTINETVTEVSADISTKPITIGLKKSLSEKLGLKYILDEFRPLPITETTTNEDQETSSEPISEAISDTEVTDITVSTEVSNKSLETTDEITVENTESSTENTTENSTETTESSIDIDSMNEYKDFIISAKDLKEKARNVIKVLSESHRNQAKKFEGKDKHYHQLMNNLDNHFKELKKIQINKIVLENKIQKEIRQLLRVY